MSRDIVCVGEVLWDSLPAGLFLGGAPLNVARSLAALGESAAIISRIGDDLLGLEARLRTAASGAEALLQVDPHRPTGLVRVTLDERCDATYDFMEPSAWDHLEATEELMDRGASSRAVVFGTLGQRNPAARAAIRQIVAAAPVRILDLNLRHPNPDPAVVDASLDLASILKLNSEEMQILRQRLVLPSDDRGAAEELARTFGLEAVCVTRGAEGAGLYREGEWTERPGVSVKVVDTVGAGDAFLAALVQGLMKRWGIEKMLDFANRVGAHVVSQNGAVPSLQAMRRELAE